MNKVELTKALVKQTQVDPQIASEFIDKLFETVAENLVKGEKITLAGLGTFSTHLHKQRATLHPKTKQPIELPALKMIKFQPSDKLKHRLETSK